MRKFRKEKLAVGGLTSILIVCLISFFAMLCCIPPDASAQSSQTACSHCQPVKAKVSCHTTSSESESPNHCPMQEIVTSLKGLAHDSSAFIKESFQKVVFVTPVDLKIVSTVTTQYSLLPESSRESDSQPLYLMNSVLRI